MKSQSSTTIDLKENERIDDLQRNGYKIIQNEKKFCFGMDAVLLSGYAKVKEGERVLDIGTGTGIIPILLCAKSKGEHFTGIEIQEESAEMATRSVILNSLEDRISIIAGDIKDGEKYFRPEEFDVVVTNPPYMKGTHGQKSEDSSRMIARHELTANLDEIVRQGSRALKVGGRLYMVHRPFRLVEIFSILTKYKLEPKRMQLVYPYVDKDPNMVLIEAVKGGKSRITVEKPLIVYQSKGKYTDEIYEIYGY